MIEALSLRQLRYLQAVARTGHFGRAAQLCHITQPALSMQIRQLEETLRFQLFERGQSGARLTPQGKEIARRADEVLMKVADLLDYAHHARSILTGELKLGVIPTIAPYLLPVALPELARRYPDLRLRLRETQTSTLLGELAGGRLDVVLAALPVDMPELEEIALFDDPFLLAVPAGHILAHRRTVDANDIEAEHILLLEEGHCFRDQALSVCRKVSPAMVNDFGASSLATILQMVSSGHGITLIPALASATETANRAAIAVLPFAPPAPSRTIGLIWRKSSARKVDFVALGKLLTDVARHTPAAG